MSTTTMLRPDARVAGAWTKSAATLGGTASDMLDAINTAGTSEWLNPAPVSNNFFEFFEVDLTSLNSGNPVTVVSLRVDIAWRHDKDSVNTGTWRAQTAALDSNDALVRGPQETHIWYNPNNAATYDYGLGYVGGQLPKRYTTADGRNWSDFDRVGFTVESFWGDGTGEIRVYEVVLYVEWEPGGSGTSDAVTGTLTAPTGSPTIGGTVTASWSFANTAGNPQTHWELEVTASGASPGTGVEVWGTGKIAGETTRTRSVDEPLDPGDYDMHLRVWSTTAGGQTIRSGWDTETFTVPAVSTTAGEGTPSAPSAVTLAWNPPDAAVHAYIDEPRPSGIRYWDVAEVQRSTDGGTYEQVGFAEEDTTTFEELLASHDADYILICAEDIAAGAEVWPVRHPAGVADGTFVTTGNASRVLDWPGDHYLWLPGVTGNTMSTQAAVPFAATGDVEVRFDFAAEDRNADQQIFAWDNSLWVELDDSSDAVKITVYDGSNLPVWVATAAQLGMSSLLDGSRIQIRAVVDMGADSCDFYTRPVDPDLSTATGWTLAHTDSASTIPAQDGVRDSGSSTARIGQSAVPSKPLRGRVYEVAAYGAGVMECRFWPAEIGGVDQANPNAGYDGWTSALGDTWVLAQDDNAEANPVAHVITSAAYMTTHADSTDAAVFADEAIRAKFSGVTASGGQLTVLAAFRPDVAGASAVQSVWSTEVNTSESLSLRLFTTTGQTSARIEGSTTGVAEAHGYATDGERLAVATVVDAGTLSVWDSSTRTLSAGEDITGIGTLPVPGDFTLGARSETVSTEDFAGTFSMVAILSAALTELEIEELEPSLVSGRRLFRRWCWPDQPQHNVDVLYRARGLNAARSKASAWTAGNLTALASEGWWMIDTVSGAVLQPSVSNVEREEPESVVVIDQLPPTREAVVVSSGPQATRLTLTFRTLSRSERVALETFLAGRGPWRLINALGEEWIVKQAGGRSPTWVRAAPTSTEVTGLRDFYETSVPFVEVEV